jgi:hypothetical protein
VSDALYGPDERFSLDGGPEDVLGKLLGTEDEADREDEAG